MVLAMEELVFYEDGNGIRLKNCIACRMEWSSADRKKKTPSSYQKSHAFTNPTTPTLNFPSHNR